MKQHSKRIKKALYDAGVSCYIQLNGCVDKAIEKVNESQFRGELTKKQAFDLRETIRRIGTNEPSVYLKEIGL